MSFSGKRESCQNHGRSAASGECGTRDSLRIVTRSCHLISAHYFLFELAKTTPRAKKKKNNPKHFVRKIIGFCLTNRIPDSVTDSWDGYLWFRQPGKTTLGPARAEPSPLLSASLREYFNTRQGGDPVSRFAWDCPAFSTECHP